jgi:probable H4MPT-linked C1 transfer pathway protein
MSPRVLGLDIGGANLKAAHTDGTANSRPFALWKRPGELAAALRDLVASFPAFDRMALTMTGELCDCFATKREGVRHILAAVTEIAGPTPVAVWRTDGNFTDLAGADGDPLPTAAANWLALATWAGRFAPEGPALLIDIGSTTTDIVALLDGRPIPEGRTDTERLWSGELVYVGVRRTPVCTLLGLRGAAELFATTQDLYLLLGTLAGDASDCDTADGRPATQEFAHARLARMLCGDAESISRKRTLRLARRCHRRLCLGIGRAVRRQVLRLPGPPRVMTSGSGRFLALEAWFATPNQPPLRLASPGEFRYPGIAAAACAYAVAVLDAERAA